MYVVIPISHKFIPTRVEDIGTVRQVRDVAEWATQWTTPNNMDAACGATKLEALCRFTEQRLRFPLGIDPKVAYMGLDFKVQLLHFNDQGKEITLDRCYSDVSLDVEAVAIR